MFRIGFTLQCLVLLLAIARPAYAESSALEALLKQRIDGDRSGVCITAVRISTGNVDGTLKDETASACATAARGLPMPPTDRYEIGSISKAFTGVLVSEMIERGELSLDDPAQKYLPDGVTMPTFDGKVVTLRDLVTHTAGLPALPTRFRPADRLNPYADVDAAVILGSLADVKLASAPGERYAYSNWGFMLLSDMLGRVAGKPYDVLLTERVLRPLGLNDTVVADKTREVPGHTSYGSMTPPWDIPARFGGVGAIRSTAADMAKFAHAMLGEVPATAPASLKKALVSSMKQQREGNARLALATAWHLAKRGDGAVWVFHNGMTGGFSSMLLLDLNTRRAAVLLADAAGGFDDLAFRMLDETSPLRLPARSVALDEELAKQLVGRYEMQPGFVITISLESGSLLAQATGQGQFELKQDARGDYYATVADIVVRFTRAAGAPATSMTLFQGGGARQARRIEP